MSSPAANSAFYWGQLTSQQPAQVAAGLSGLLAGLHSPGSLEHVQQLLSLLQRSKDPAIAGPTLTLLARWARQRAPLLQQQTGRGATGKEADKARVLLQQAAQEALKVIAAGGVQQGAGPAAALLLGSVAAGCPAQLRWQVAEALGSALLAQAAGRDSVAAAAQPALPPRELIWSLAGLLPVLLDTPVAACWVLSALISACQLTAGVITSSPPGALADALAPCYAMMRAVAGATLSKAHPGEAVPQLLQPLATVLIVAVGEAMTGATSSIGNSGAGGHTSEGSGGSNPPRLPTPPLLQEAASWGLGGASGGPGGSGASARGLPTLQRVPWALLPPAAAAVLCLGGLLEGVCRAAPGFEPCQAVMREAEDTLIRAASTASAWDLESLVPQRPASSGGTPRGAALAAQAAGRGGEGEPGELAAAAAALLRDCVSLSCVQAFQACGRPVPSHDIMHCQAGTLLRCALSLDPFFELAASGATPAMANALLARQLAAAPMERAAELAGAVARAAGAADYADRAVLVGRFREAAQRAYRGYQVYTLNTPGGFLGAVDSQAVRSVLDKLFMSATVVLSAVWATELAEHASALQGRAPAGGGVAPLGSSGSPATSTGGLLGLLLGGDDSAAAAAAAGGADGAAGEPLVRAASSSVPALAAELLAVFADLQFARLPLDLFGNFLKEALAAVSGDAGAARALAACFPPYNELSAPCQSRAGAPAWLMDAVVASKVQFLMSVLMPCCHLLYEPTILEHLAPLSFLYLLHPHQPASAAAHQFFAALLPAVALRSREPLAAFYIERTLEGYPGATALEPLQQGLVSMLCALPEGSSMSLYSIEAMLRKCRALEAGGRDPELVVQLFGLAAGLLLVIDQSFLRSALSAVGSFVEGGGALGATRPAAASAALLSAVYEVLAATDDATRKPELVMWYQRLAAGVAKQRHK